MHQRLKRILFTLLAPFLLGLVWFYVPASTRYHIEEAYTFQSNEKGAKVRLAIMLPKSGPNQTVKNPTVSWEGAETRESHRSVDVVKFAGDIEARQEQVATVAYDVVLHQGRTRWELPVEDSHLQPQEGIEADNPVIAEEASRIAQDQSRDSAYEIFKFTASRISTWKGRSGSGLNLRIQSALEAYESQTGVCGHFASLMTALCRAAKIPAQPVSGLTLPAYPPLWSATGPVWRHPAGGSHGWVEFHTSAGWEMADPSAAFRMPVKRIWFGRNDGSYLRYGERSYIYAVSKKMKAWAETEGKLVGGMTGPYRFAAGADTNGVSVRPQAMLKVAWDGRWFNSFVLIVLLLVAWYRPWRWRQRKQSNSAKAQRNKGDTSPIEHSA